MITAPPSGGPWVAAAVVAGVVAMCTSTISIVGMYSLRMVYGGSKKRKERRRGVHTRLVILIGIKTMTKEKEGHEG